MRKLKKSALPADPGDEIALLIRRLQRTEQRLQALTGGELDSVLLGGGHSFLLQQAQEKLRSSEAVQSCILNALPAHIALLDDQGVILSVNDGWRHYAGENALEGSGCGQGQNYLAICERAAGDCAAEARAAAAGIRTVMSGAAKQFSLEYPCHSPTVQSWFRLMVSPVNPTGPGGAVVMHLDITARKLAEHSVRESEQRLRLITNLVPIGIFAKDAAGRHLFANPALAELAGLSIPEIVGKTDFDLVSDPAQAEAYRADDRTVIQSGRKLVIPEERRTDLAGRTRFLQTIKIPFTVGDTDETGVLGVCLDITERKQAEEKLRESEERFRGMFTDTATGMAISTPHGRFLKANAAYCQMLGYTEAELQERDFPSITHPDDLALNLELRDQVLAGVRESFVMEKRYLKKNGDIVWTRHSVSALRKIGGTIASFIVVVEDISQRKCAEETLRLRQTELQVLFDLAPVMIWFKDTQNGILRVNQRAAAALGKAVADLEGKSLHDIFPRDAAKYYADDLEVIRSGLPKLEIFETMPTKNGRELLVQTDKVPVCDQTGQVTGIIVMVQDITERKRTETRFRRLVDSNAQGVFFWNRQGRISDGNDAFLRLVGHSRAELLAGGLHWPEMTPPEYAGRDQRALQEVAETGICTMYEKEFIRKDGTRAFIMIGAANFEDNPNEGVAFVFDLTERLKSEKALRQSEKRFKAIFEQAAVGFALADAATGQFLQVNQRYCDIVGRTPAELTQLPPAAITHPEHHARDQELEGKVKAGTLREFALEKRYQREDGSETWVHVTVSAIWAPGEAPDYFLRVVQDITMRKKLEDSARQAQKMEAMGTLAGGIAHDFNNILASINGYTELAQLTLTGNPKVREYMDAVLHAGHRATALVRQILAFSRQEKLQREPVDLRPVVAETLKLLRATIPANIEFVTALAADAPIVLADANQIHQILMNLGTNAWHAMKGGNGQIEVRLERFEVDEVYAASQPRLRPGRYARLSVGDTGCGMDAATLRRIFEPFFTTKPTGQGTGLGLSVVHGIMESHDGVVTVYSQPGLGTVFNLYFPADASAEVPVSPEAEQVPRGRGERILLVDDEASLVQLGRNTLSALGYEVEATTQPLEALEIVRAAPHRFALVITDQTMPKLTGLELADQLRQIRPGLPMILMTGFSLAITAERVRAAGVSQLLLKPASLQSLGNAIHAILHADPAAPTSA